MWKRFGLVGLGLALILASATSRWWLGARGHSPGRLVARIAQVDWQSPQGEADRSSKPRFELRNIGDEVVRVLEVSSGCGCATPRVQPRVIPPGGNAIVEVEADPLEFGGRSVGITIRTDSREWPEIPLTLNVHGRQRPPYVARAVGDLYYRHGYSVGGSRIIDVDIIEMIDGDHEPPKVSVNLPYFEVGEPASEPTERMYAPDKKLYVYSWKMPLVMSSQPPAEGFHGSVIVYDPWIKGRSIEIPIHGEADPPVRVVPARLVLTLPPNKSGSEPPEATFFVQVKDLGQPLRVENARGEESPIVIEAVKRDKGGRDEFSAFRLSIKSGEETPPEGVYEIVAYVEGREAEKAVVQVLVKYP